MKRGKIDLSAKQSLAFFYLLDGVTTEIGYGGGAGCFTADTLVLTQHGKKPISRVHEGDLVYTWDKEKLVLKPVLQKFMYRSSSLNTRVIKVKLRNGQEIKCTESHEFLHRGDWIPIRQLIWREVENCSRNEWNIRDKQQRKIENTQLAEFWKNKNNETFSGQRLLQNNDSLQRKIENCCSTSFSGRIISTTTKQSDVCKPQRFQQMEQSGGKSGVCNASSKFSSFSSGGTSAGLVRTSGEDKKSKTIERITNRDKQTERKRCDRYSQKVQAENLHQENVSKRIWSSTVNNKRYYSASELETRDIISFEFIEEEYVYDLEVDEHHNYIINDQNIIVHNSGKSWLGVLWVTHMCLKYPGVSYLIGRRELTNLKRTTLMTFFKFVEYCGGKADDMFKYNQQNNTITFHNGSVIFLMDMSYQPSDPLYTRFGGLELTGAFVDESNENEEKAIQILKTRIGRCKNKEYKITPKILETFNPDKGHVYQRYYKPYRDKTNSNYNQFIPALATDNPHLDPAYIEQLKKSDKITRERLLFGNFEYSDSPWKLMYYDNIVNMFTNSFIEHGKKCMSIDVARMGKDKTVIFVWSGFRVESCYVQQKSRINDLAAFVEDLSRQHEIPRSNIVIDEDGVGGGLHDFLPGSYGFVNNSSPIKQQHDTYNFGNLKSQCYYMLSQLVNENKLFLNIVEPSYKDALIQELEQIERKNPDKDGKFYVLGKDEIKQRLGRSTDFADALMMRMALEFKKQVTIAF